ncbi:caspase family protein, partial [Reichenbachiella sp. MALMAid0571]|uniref:caspase family protein n=1 Tax=Reichenbachiella sp. MALMAid0571 TaxID=3143939 RepID=UPI0032E056AA
DNNYDLNYAAKDANDIAAKFGTDASKVFKITDTNATKEKILAVKSSLMKSKVDDRVILFVAGHGLLDDNLDYFIGTHDVDFENPSARGLPYEDLESLLDGIPARKKLMFIDACHSGEVDKDDAVVAEGNPTGLKDLSGLTATIASRGFKTIVSKSNSLGLENSFQLMQELFADLRKGTGAVVISSASGAEFAL